MRELSSSDADELRAARVSVGALGVLSEITLQTVPGFRLHKVEEPRPVVEVLEQLDELVAQHDHFEFYAFPYSPTCLTIASDRTDAPPAPAPRWKSYLMDDVLANRALEAFSRAGRRYPRRAPQISRTMTRFLSRTETTDHSHLVYASERRVRFSEMEYALPREKLREVLTDVLATIEREQIGVTFPIEVRFTAPDDALLSTAFGRDTAYVAVHQFLGMPLEPYFPLIEALMVAAGGRPHWGKRHTQTAETLAPRYPEWGSFQAVRAQLDPTGVFTNDYIRRVLGPPRDARAA